jgi:hypothetical protein
MVEKKEKGTGIISAIPLGSEFGWEGSGGGDCRAVLPPARVLESLRDWKAAAFADRDIGGYHGGEPVARRATATEGRAAPPPGVRRLPQKGTSAAEN